MRIIDCLLSVIAPHDCMLCGLEGVIMCKTCEMDAFEPTPERCYRCLRLSRDSKTCKACRRFSPLRHVWVSTEYEAAAKQLIMALKFERLWAAHLPIAERVAADIPYFEPGTIVAHVPTATTRQRQRGYDQSELIAKEIARLSSMVFASVLERRDQLRQVGSTRKQRITQTEDMFYVKRPESVRGRHVVLVDDIVTTGASLESAARALKAAGAKQVDAAVFAQKL